MAVKLAGSLLVFALVTSLALAAQAADKTGPRNALSLHPFSLGAHGVALQYERRQAATLEPGAGRGFPLQQPR